MFMNVMCHINDKRPDFFIFQPPIRLAASDGRVIQVEVPLGIGRVFHLAPIEILGAIGPPDFTALAQGNFGLVDTGPSRLQGCGVFGCLGGLDCTTCSHQLIHKVLADVVAQGGIGAPPELPLDHEIPTIRRGRVHLTNTRGRPRQRRSGLSPARPARPARTAWSALACKAAGGNRPARMSWRNR